jgi:hypothetical protein
MHFLYFCVHFNRTTNLLSYSKFRVLESISFQMVPISRLLFTMVVRSDIMIVSQGLWYKWLNKMVPRFMLSCLNNNSVLVAKRFLCFMLHEFLTESPSLRSVLWWYQRQFSFVLLCPFVFSSSVEQLPIQRGTCSASYDIYSYFQSRGAEELTLEYVGRNAIEETLLRNYCCGIIGEE